LANRCPQVKPAATQAVFQTAKMPYLGIRSQLNIYKKWLPPEVLAYEGFEGSIDVSFIGQDTPQFHAPAPLLRR